MQYRQLGSSGIAVSEIALGSWLTYSGGVDKARAIACVRRALDLGITLIDTANVYGHGAAETLLGEALAGVPRQSYVLATKLFFPMGDGEEGLSRAQVAKQLDASLKRLRTDHVDLYQCHRYDPDTPLAETMEALTEAVRQGKVRCVGFSEWSADQVRAALAIPGVVRFAASQPQYSLLWRKPEQEILPLCAANGIAQIVWSPLGQGVLTGKYRPGAVPPVDSRAASGSMGSFMRRGWLGRPVLEAVERVAGLARQAGLTPAQFALAWVLRRPEVAAAIVGATRPEQVAENAAASGAAVDPALFAEAERLLEPALAAAR
ncbi:MAG: aldo/keto reductase family protein [Dongiaceae bacterium]